MQCGLQNRLCMVNKEPFLESNCSCHWKREKNVIFLRHPRTFAFIALLIFFIIFCNQCSRAPAGLVKSHRKPLVTKNNIIYVKFCIKRKLYRFICLVKRVTLSLLCSLEHLEVAKSTQTMNEEELKRVSGNYDAFFFHPVCKLNCFLYWELQVFVTLHLSGTFPSRGKLARHFLLFKQTYIYL